MGKPVKIFNALTLNMIPRGHVAHFLYQKSHQIHDVVQMTGLVSFVGHNDLAKMLYLPTNRASTTVSNGENFLVAQWVGDKLPDGSKVMPIGASIEIHEYCAIFLSSKFEGA
jgi:hypothetical protein